MESRLWERFSEDYDGKILSLTKIPQRRKQILERIRSGTILNLGCGSTSYLNRDLIAKDNYVIATDFCQAMLDIAQEDFTHHNLEYRLADSRRLPFEDCTFDSVIAVNSILPPERKDVYRMVQEVYRVLKIKGVFVAFLVSYDATKRAKQNLGLDIEIDDKQMRAIDTTGWQCTHTPNSIKEMMARSGFSEYDFRKVVLKTRAEIKEIQRLYGIDTSKSFIYEYLLVAYKN